MAIADHSRTTDFIEIPPSAYTLDGFTQWTYSDEFPQQGKITFVDGRILIDMSPERAESHAKLKQVINRVIDTLICDHDLGEYYPDGITLRNPIGGVSHEPDALFVSWETLESGKCHPGTVKQEGNHVDLIGTPDWVCEVLSDSSVKKDTQDLRAAYHKAGIPEYWLVDARGEEIDFQVLVWQPEGYVNQNDREGWKFSPVFKRHFQFTRERNRVGTWRYRLQHRQD